MTSPGFGYFFRGMGIDSSRTELAAMLRRRGGMRWVRSKVMRGSKNSGVARENGEPSPTHLLEYSAEYTLSCVPQYSSSSSPAASSAGTSTISPRNSERGLRPLQLFRSLW